MVAYSFQKRFAPRIEDGSKRHTIRADRRRHARPGEALQLYVGMRTTTCRKIIADPLCTSVEPIRINFDEAGLIVEALIDGQPVSDLGEFALADGFETLFEQDDGDKAINAFRIKFASGFEIMALSSAPRGLRGKQGVVIIDEAAFVDQLKELLKAALAFLIWGGQVIVCSTHDGVDNEFNVAIQEVLAGRAKGFSFTEIIWDTSEGQWQPSRLEWRDPRWFGFDQRDLTTPMIRGDNGQLEDLPGGKFIYARIAAKSGLPLRSGIARVAAWAWMFKAFTQRDWTIFTQTYGQPIRLGKFGAGATEQDKATLMRAVSNIAGDMAAIIPESMMIELIHAANIGAAHALYKERSDWLDQQVSKAVLGQTATTDAMTGGLGSGKEHREVQKDIETADAKATGAILTRDLARTYVMLNYGQRRFYPRILLQRPEEEDLKAFADAAGPMIDRGLEVSQDDVREKFGLPAPKPGAKLMTPSGGRSAPLPVSNATATGAPDPNSKIKGNPGEIKRGEGRQGVTVALNAEGASAAISGGNPVEAAVGALTARLEEEADAHIAGMIDQVEVMLETASSLEEFREMLLAGFPALNSAGLASVMSQAMLSAWGAGRVAVEEEAGD